MTDDMLIPAHPDDDAVEPLPGDDAVERELLDDGEAGRQEEFLDLPLRPRRRFLTPAPVALLCALLTTVGFIAGVRVEKGRTSGASAGGGASPFAAAFRRSFGAGDGGAGATGGGTAGGLTVGKVANIDKNTLYLTNDQGNTIAVTVPSGLKVNKTVAVSGHEIHPGDTIVVQGSRGLKGNLSARSISITTGEGFGGISASFAGPGNGAASSGGSGAAGGSGSQPLFGG